MTIVDLPGIYSLSPYTLEEVIARDYILGEKPDVIINIINASNLERNLYLTTQLAELGVPMVAALNMMDIVEKRRDRIDILQLAARLGCPVVGISAARGKGISELVETSLSVKTAPLPQTFDTVVEDALSAMADVVSGAPALAEYPKRWAAVKLLERDEALLSKAKLSDKTQKRCGSCAHCAGSCTGR